MSGSVREMIEQKNRQVAASAKRVFGKKANDQQHHSNLLKHVEIVMDAYGKEPSHRADRNFASAMQELKTAMVLSQKRLQS